VKTPVWEVVAWNRAALAVLANYETLPEGQRNVLRLMFTHGARERNRDWVHVARSVVGAVRRDVARAGMRAETQALIDQLSEESAEFRAMWAEQDVQAYGEGRKQLTHPVVGALDLEYSTFDVDGRPDLALVVFNPATETDCAKVRQLIAGQENSASD